MNANICEVLRENLIKQCSTYSTFTDHFMDMNVKQYFSFTITDINDAWDMEVLLASLLENTLK
jgi:hypothetical protein